MSGIADELAAALGAVPTVIAPLGGGAGRCTMWTVEAGGRSLVFRRFPEGPARDVVKDREWRVLQLARDAGVPVPEPVARTPSGIVVERVDGEADPRRLLTEDRFAHARTVLVARVATAAARLHAIDPPDSLPDEPELEGRATGADVTERPPWEAALVTLERQLDAFAERHPALELGLRWLRLNAPGPAPRAIVHGDLRLSNLVVSEDGRPALIDWELVHAGDGAEDLGWMCMRSWRFGSLEPALGCGSREELLAAYAAAGGRAVSLEELRWWEVCANARWGAICLLQAHRGLSESDRSLERAMIGRRTCEAEWDLLSLLADGRPAPPGAKAPQDRPDAQALLDEVATYLRDLRSRVPEEEAFMLAVAAKACRVVRREIPPEEPGMRDGADRLSAEIRGGRHDDRLGELVDPLRAQVRGKLEIANPRWLA